MLKINYSVKIIPKKFVICHILHLYLHCDYNIISFITQKNSRNEKNEDSGFEKTGKMVTVTFNGWDGKSYNGESRILSSYTNKDYPNKEFVRVIQKDVICYFAITGRLHPVSGISEITFFTSL